MDILTHVAGALVAPGKGIIAADESSGTCQKRFDAVGIPCTEENRRSYREVIIGAPGLGQYISGIILYDETIRQKTAAGKPFPDVLKEQGIIPGIKVDMGAKEFALHPGEKVTEGLDGLRERLAEYKKLGAQFAKWRAVIAIGPDLPSAACIRANAHALGRYAALCEEADIVPIIEPEVLIDGTHTIKRSGEVTHTVLAETFRELDEQGVAAEGVILKASMVIAGKPKGSQSMSTPQEVAAATVACLTASVPKNLAGVVFLSGGQGDEQATANLNAMHQLGALPWPLSFSYSRAIQNPVLKIWAENPSANVEKARAALLFRSRMNALASQGKYSDALEKERPY
jgi:fructose-bisphosphate aldolase class I